MSGFADVSVPDDAGGTRRWMQSAHGHHLSGLLWGPRDAPVVAVHDLGEDATAWSEVAAGVPVGLVALDLPGHGRSSASLDAPTPARTALAVLDAAWSFAPRSPLLVGRGHGAAAALGAARRRPDRIRGVAVLSTSNATDAALATADVESITTPVVLLRPLGTALDPVASAVAAASNALVIDIDATGDDVLHTAGAAVAAAIVRALSLVSVTA